MTRQDEHDIIDRVSEPSRGPLHDRGHAGTATKRREGLKVSLEYDRRYSCVTLLHSKLFEMEDLEIEGQVAITP
jgi:hypothetical protein